MALQQICEVRGMIEMAAPALGTARICIAVCVYILGVSNSATHAH
jgi:hypothetical protein